MVTAGSAARVPLRGVLAEQPGVALFEDADAEPGNEPSLRLARHAGYRFEQRLHRHCRDWSCEDAEHDSWHDCLIWTHVSDRTPHAGHATGIYG